MIAWIVLLILLIAEGAGLAWWLRKEYYTLFFNGNAPMIYSAVLAADFIATWLVSFLVQPGGMLGAGLLALAGVLLVIVVVALTFFFRWVVKTDMNDIK